MSTTETFDFADAQSTALVAKEGAATLESTWLAFRVQSNDDRERAIATAKAMKEMREQLEAERDSGTKPLLGVVDRIRGWFRGPVDALARIERHLKDEVARFKEEAAKAQRAALLEAKSHVEVERAVAVLTPKVAGEGSRKTWSAEVVTTPQATFAAITALHAEMVKVCPGDNLPMIHLVNALGCAMADRLPDSYIGVDAPALNKVAVALKGAFAVPGAKAVCKESVVLR